jgi:Family of unknown function (DUF6445)
MFNSAARFDTVRFANGQACLIVDEALREPERLVAFASEHCTDFSPVNFNAYPGIFLPVPEAMVAALADFFNLRIRRHFDARRLLHMHCRLSMVTLAPADLVPTQCLAHRDQPTLDPGHSIQASILYLFRDPGLGGTSFYEPARPEEEIRRLSADAMTMAPAEFFATYGLAPRYLGESNAWFTHVGRVNARWNRCIFFDGYALHSGDIPQPERLTGDPLTGRLTFNGFFTSRRHLR